jgi:hypothetical protein
MTPPAGCRGAYLGIDTIAVRGEVISARTPDTRIEALRVVDGPTGEIGLEKVISRLPSGGRLMLSQRAGGCLFATIEASVPKVRTGSNFDPSSVMSAVEVLESLYDEAGQWCRWNAPLMDLSLTRVDATGHINGVTHRDRHLRTLAMLNVRSLPTNLRNDPQRGGALTLSSGPGRRWKMHAYDKTAEIRARATRCRGATREQARRDLGRSDGILRCELVLRSPSLRAVGMATVRELDEETLAREHRKQFHRVGLGLSVAGFNKIIESVENMPEKMSGHDEVMMLGLLLCDLAGYAPRLGAVTARKHRNNARDLGFVPDMLLDLGSSVRLDYDSARQVAS